MMAIRCSDTFTMPAGEQRADVLIAAVPSRAWQRICTGAGAHGPREFDWARIPVQTGWRREECFQQAKGEAGLDHYQVRSWRAWYWRRRRQRDQDQTASGSGAYRWIRLMSMVSVSLHRMAIT